MTPERYQHIWALYEEAEKLLPTERPVFLSRVCAEDRTLQEEVESLFVAEVAAANFLGTNAFAEAARAYAAHPDPYHLAGRTILDGRYQIEILVGRGGMGAVYKAQQTRIQRPVAFKVLLPHLAHDEKALQSFWREGRLIGQLQHPHIVQVYDSGELTLDDITYYYIVMEWVPGRTLAQELEETGPLSLDRSLHILQQVTDALEAAHTQNIVHLDLKPSNILLAPTQAGAEHIKVVDFGIARIVSGTDQLSARSNFGSLPYMSPEQLAEKKVSERSDIFSLGVVLYEMLTGEIPFPTLQRTWPAPSARRHRTDIPLLTDEYLQTFLSEDPKVRPRYLKSIPRNFENTFRVYQTRLIEGEQAFQAREYKQAIESWQEALTLAPGDTQVQARINASRQEIEREVERRREKRAAARKQKKARAEKLLAEGDEAFRSYRYAEAHSAWKEAVRMAPKEVEAGWRMLIVERLLQAATRYNRLAATLRILLYQTLGRLVLLKNEPWVVLVRPHLYPSFLVLGLLLSLFLLGAGTYRVWDASLEQGIHYLEQGAYERAVSEINLVIIKQSENAEAYLCRAKAYSFQQDYEHVIEDLTSYLRLKEGDPQGYFLRGEALLTLCKCEDAINDFKQAITLCRTVPAYYERLAKAHHQKGDLEGAIQAYAQKIKVEKGNPDSYVTLAKIYLEKGLTELATEKMEQALRLKQEPQYYFIQGGIYFDLKNYDRAIEDYRNYIALKKGDAIAYYKLGLSYYRKKAYDAAIENFSQSLTLDNANPEAHFQQGAAYYEKQQYQRALADLDQAINLWEEKTKNASTAEESAEQACSCNVEHERERRSQNKNAVPKIDPRIFYLRGCSYFYLGNSEQAEKDLEQAWNLTRDPGLEREVKQQLEKLRQKGTRNETPTRHKWPPFLRKLK